MSHNRINNQVSLIHKHTLCRRCRGGAHTLAEQFIQHSEYSTTIGKRNYSNFRISVDFPNVGRRVPPLRKHDSRCTHTFLEFIHRSEFSTNTDKNDIRIFESSNIASVSPLRTNEIRRVHSLPPLLLPLVDHRRRLAKVVARDDNLLPSAFALHCLHGGKLM